MEAPSLGSRSVKRPFLQQNLDAAAPFMITGVHALLFDDDTLAAFINSPAALLPWNGDRSLLIDRYDVRHLLQDLSGVRKRRPAPLLTDASEEELNYERFRDLHEILSNAPQEEPRAFEESLRPSAGGYQAVPFSYSVDGTENVIQTESSHRSVGFHPPFPLPDSLLSKLPPTEKLHQIIMGTAKFVKEHGGQSEVLLKVKQGSNPLFGFLNVDHHLHEYYRFLLQNPELLQPASESLSKPTETRRTGEGLSLLGFAYGSGDDDDDAALRSESHQVDVVAGSGGNAVVRQEGLRLSSSGNGSKASMDTGGGLAVQGKAAATTSRSVKVDDARAKVAESVPKALPQLNKKKKTLTGSAEVIQANKRIAPRLKTSDVPSKMVSNATNQLPRKMESKTSSWHSVPSIKDMNYGMSADAAAAVVLAATRGARGLKQDTSNTKSSSSSGLSPKVQEANGQPVDGSRGITSLGLGLGQSDVKLAKAVAELAAIAASHEADSADTLLTPAEKLKAERLRKAKMFAAMIKSGKCGSETIDKPLEQPTGTSAATSARSDEMRIDGLSVNGKAISNGKGENSSLGEVEEGDMNKSAGSGSVDVASRQSGKERKYRSKEHNKSDSEESEHQRKRKARQDHKGDKKHRHSKRKKHKSHDSESADSALSSSDESSGERKTKTHRRHHHRRKRSHHENHHEQDGKEGKHGHRRHKLHDEELDSSRRSRHRRHCDRSSSGSEDYDLLHKKKQRHRRHRDRSSSRSEDGETSRRVREVFEEKQLRAAASVENKQLPSLAREKSSIGSDDQTNPDLTTEVPADIREKVRAMLLSTF